MTLRISAFTDVVHNSFYSSKVQYTQNHFLVPLWKMIWFHWSTLYIYHLQSLQCLTFHKLPYYLLITHRKSIIWQEIAIVDLLLFELFFLYNFYKQLLQTIHSNFNFWKTIKTEIHYQMMTSWCHFYQSLTNNSTMGYIFQYIFLCYVYEILKNI